ncbi:MAG: thioredoxin family protein [Candidatus Obscuribacter sp.]|jgi:peroxiredoxin|nr:thioredoxin family protein [Candidatus Obscuribacter sp.]MBK7839679.1 thioredoxin family protein [Candidatus Obscuribacter sp.]MBK9618828.1 thioredoxin family protein [Candidatus Obscuribacter sp.]
MALTYSTMLELGTSAPSFTLPDVVSGKSVSLEDFAGKKALLVMFICRHCPYVKHIELELAKIGLDYKDKDLGIVAISSNDAASYPADAPDSLAQWALNLGFEFALLYDQTQEVAQSYTAACTPNLFVFDGERKLIYRGQLDDSRPSNGLPVTGSDLRGALDALLSGQPQLLEQKPSVGCNIKWRAGNEPKI